MEESAGLVLTGSDKSNVADGEVKVV